MKTETKERTKHTPTPCIFAVEGNNGPDPKPSFLIYDANGGEVARASDERSARNIVRAVNAHDELVAALKDALDAPGIWTTSQKTGQPFGDTIKAAIAKAEGRVSF